MQIIIILFIFKQSQRILAQNYKFYVFSMHRCDGALNFIIICYYKLCQKPYPVFSYLLLEIERKHFYVIINTYYLKS